MNRGGESRTLVFLATAVLIVVALYFGRPILMPLALATLFSFLFSPVVNAITRAGIHRTVSLLIVVVLFFSVLGSMIWGVGQQMSALAYELPEYKDNVREKISDLQKAGEGSALERIQITWRELKGELKRNAVTNSPAAPRGEAEPESEDDAEPVAVVVKGENGTAQWLPSALGPLVEVLATAGLVVVLVIFMLLRKQELRDRFVVLFGYSRMPTTTRALDEAAERISRYLLMQTIINGTYGMAVGIALWFIGLPYALLWGGLAAILRFIPYVGPWLGAIMPILLSLAVFPGWFHPLVVLGVILCLELVSNMIMEPLLYGQTVGVSEVALLIAVAFWTWIWGPIGLVLATPLTVCLVVLGKYVSGLSFLQLLLSDEPVMAAPARFYQRLLAMDKTEAAEIAAAFAREHKVAGLYDELLLPALVSAKKDHTEHSLSDEHLAFIVSTCETIRAGAAKLASNQPGEHNAGAPPSSSLKTILAVPIDDALDELVVRMLKDLLPATLQLEALSSQTLTGEVIDRLAEGSPSVLVLGATARGGSSEMRYLAKKVRARFPALPLIIGRWGLSNPRKRRELAETIPGASIAVALAEACNLITHFAHLDLEQTAVRPTASQRPLSPEPRLN